MNIVEIEKINKVIKLLDKVLEGKIENLPEARAAKEELEDLIEFKDIKLNRR